MPSDARTMKGVGSPYKPVQSEIPKTNGADESSLLLADLEEKEPFHPNRWRCVKFPDRAMDTLGPCAKLELNVQRGRGLLSMGASYAQKPPSSPYVCVYLDDLEVFKTPPAKSSTPVWEHKGVVEVTSPCSMIRLHVLDHDTITHEAEVGFVEFSLADVPWDKDIAGWMELRFRDTLQQTSERRYAEHCGQRDQDAHSVRHASREKTLRQNSDGLNTSFLKCGACSQGGGGGGASLDSDAIRHHAGEILVGFCLTRMGTWADSAFALALEPHVPKDFGTYVNTNDLPALDVQHLGDDINEIKLDLLDGALSSMLNFIMFILEWRYILLSGSITAAFVISGLYPKFSWVSVPLVLAGILLLLGKADLRREMTIGGLNAPFTDEGFARVARWRSTVAMTRFLKRIVEQDLQGKVTDDQHLTSCAARCFSDGKPKVSFAQLRNALRRAEWTKVGTADLESGALVLIDREHRAVVQSTGAKTPADVRVKYEDGREADVDRTQVTMRTKVPSIPTWAIPASVESQIRQIQLQVEVAKQGLHKPVRAITNVVTWQWPVATASLVIALLLFSATEAVMEFNIWGEEHSINHYASLVRHFVDWGMWYIGFFLGVLALIFNARWFREVRNFLKILFRLVCMRRRAPANWAFFEAADGDF